MTLAFTIADGDVVRNPKTGIRYRILYLFRDEAVAFNVDAPVAAKSIPPSQRKKKAGHPVEPLAAKPATRFALPELMPFRELIQWPKETWVSKIRHPESLTDAERRFHTRASGVVEFLHQNEPDIYFPKKRAALFALAMAKFEVSQRTVWMYLRSFWRAGKATSALYSSLSNCGALGILRDPRDKKRGRPPSIFLQEKNGPGINVQPGDQKNIKRAVEWYRAKPEKTLDDAYLWMLDAHYSSLFKKPDGANAWGANPQAVMNFPQFEYHSQRYLNPFDKERRAAEKNKGGKNPRDRHHGALVIRHEVGTVAEVDALHCNISLVAEGDRSLVLGAMVVIIIVECSTGMVMGFSVGWDGEAYECFADALVKCVEDKVGWCAKFGVQIEAADWPAQHLTQYLHADRGSAFMSRMADRLVEVMKPNPFANTPPMSPESKGIVENTVKLIKQVFRRRYPGTWLAKVGSQKRGVRSPHEYSGMTRNEFIRAFMDVVLEVNQGVRTTATQPQLVARGVPTTPVAYFLDAVRTHRHRLRRVDPLQLEAQLLTRMPATVSDKGIYLGNELYYLPDDGRHLASAWFKKMAQDEAGVSLALNRETVDVAFLCMPGKGGELISCSLSPRSSQFRGKSLREVEMTRQRKNELNKVEEQHSLPKRVKRAASMSRDGKEATAKTKAAIGNIPNAERDIGNRHENRSQERAQVRQVLGKDLRQRHGASGPPIRAPETSDEENFDYPDIDDE